MSIDFIKYVRQLFCVHVWVDDYIVYKTLWPYTIVRKSVKRCAKCGKVKE